MTTARRIFLTLGVLVFAFFGYGSYLAHTPEGRQRIAERERIELCQATADLFPTSLEVSGKCLQLRIDYRKKWGRKP